MIYKVFDNSPPAWCEHRLGVELDSVHIELLVAHGHNVAFLALGGNHKVGRKALVINHPRVIAPHNELLWQAAENVVVGNNVDGRLNAVENIAQVAQLAAEHLANGLVAKANAQNRLFVGVGSDNFGEQPRLRRNAWSWRQHNLVCISKLAHFKLVVSHNRNIGTRLLNHLAKVVGERIVIVYNCNFHCFNV